MKTPSPTHVILRAVFTLALSAVAVSPLLGQPAEPASEPMMTTGRMAERHQDMQSRREKMMTEMMAEDTELNAQLAQVKSAPETQKVDLLIALVARMVEQRTALHARMADVMKQMMADMPMESGSRSSHPMMNGMENKPAGTTGKQN